MEPERQGIAFDAAGLVPAVVQDWRDGTVLMVGYMNKQAIADTFATKFVHFWSSTRGKILKKGETSGQVLLVK